MITKVTKENNSLYKELFQKANQYLYEQEDATEETGITSIDDYFRNLTTLTAADPVFKILPLDEPTLDIDTETRIITVPKSFKNNGIAVKGDQIAEILYFTVDRYFENVDLAHDDTNIIIQWETAPKNGVAEQGISKAFIKDVSIFKKEGKLLFGWALNTNITENPGTIKFAVRFYRTHLDTRTGKPQITFNLSTLTANAIINPGLDYEYNNEMGQFVITPIDDSELINSRITDSAYTGPSDAASTPTFTQNIEGSIPNTGTAENPYYEADLDSDGKYVFNALATAVDGKITYTWKRIPLGSTVASSLDGDRDGYRITTDTTYQEDKAYFTKTMVQNIMRYVSHTGTVGDPIPTNIDVYEYGTSKTIQKTANNVVTGDYYVEAQNRHGVAKAYADSHKVRIPGPATLTASVSGDLTSAEDVYQAFLDDTDHDVTLTVTGSTPNNDTIKYSWEKKVEGVYTAIDNATASLVIDNIAEDAAHAYDTMYKASVAAYRNGDTTAPQTFEFRVTHNPEAPVITIPEDEFYITGTESVSISVVATTPNINSDSLTYQWYKHTSAEDDTEDIAGATSDTYVVEGVANAGSYYCKVTNKLNGKTITVTSGDIRVTPN